MLLQLNNAGIFWQTMHLNWAAVWLPDNGQAVASAGGSCSVCACPVRMRRAESWVMVSSTWLARNISAVSTIANKRAKNAGATRANCTTASPFRLRRNLRNRLRKVVLDWMVDDMGRSWAAMISAQH